MIRTFIAAAALAVCPAIALRADVIYSNFGPSGDPFDPDSGDPVSQSTNLMPSFAFPSTVAQEVTEVDFVTSIGVTGDVNQVTVSLSSDGGGQPGTVLATQVFNGAMGILGGEGDIPPDGPTVISWILSTPVDLLSGDTYWITLGGPAPGDVTWNYNTTGQSGYSDFVSGSWVTNPTTTMGALQILGTAESSPTPEPGTALLLGLGLAGVIGFRRGVR